jgi:O-antigen/teichoic acid export membrane protein
VASPAIAVPELWLQMTERLRLCSLAQVVGLGVGAGWRILLVLTNGPLVAYAFAYVAETMIGAALIVVFARRSGLRWPLTKASTEIVKSLLDSAWPLALASLAVILYMRLDAIMLRWISGEAEVGMYAAGIRFVEVWYFLPVLLCTTLLPRLLAAKEQSSNQYDHVLQKLYNISTGSALSIALIVAGASSYIIRFAFGDRFQGAESVCFIYAWTLPLIALGTVRSQHLVNEGRNLFYLGATAAGLILNILLNLIFIRQWGATGAAAATLLSQLAATWLSSLWLEDDRKSFRMQAVALAFPFSYVWQRLSGRLVR